jgi:hypothetical protein
VAVGVLHSIMVGLYIKYTFTRPRRAISVAAFAILICSHAVITGLGFTMVKFNVVKYMIGLVLHAFTFPFHHLFLCTASYLKETSVPIFADKNIHNEVNEIHSIYVSAIIFLNFAVFCIFFAIDNGTVHLGKSKLIEILSYYFSITYLIKVVCAAVYLGMSLVGSRKNPNNMAKSPSLMKGDEKKNEAGKSNMGGNDGQPKEI